MTAALNTKTSWRTRLFPDWTAVAALLLIVAANATLPAERNRNYRDTVNASWNLLRSMRGLPSAEPRLPPGDDIGPTVLMAATASIAYSRRDLETLDAMPHIPRLYFVMLVVLNAACMAALYAAARALWGRGAAFALIAIFTLGSNIRFLAFSGDVYMFPWYAGVFVLLSFALLGSRSRGALAAACACSIGVILCTVFRNGSMYVGWGFLLAIVFPTALARNVGPEVVRTRAAVCLVMFLAGAAALRLVVPQSHVVWHSIHTGLMEYGGHVDAAGRIYPYFVPESDIPQNSTVATRWSDNYAKDLVSRTRPNVPVYSQEYEDIVRADAMRVISAYPSGVASLVARRLWRFFIVNPWQPTSPVSQLIDRWYDTPLRILWIAVVCIGLMRGLGGCVLVPLAALLPLAVPPLLVHSGYLMYNFPGHLAVYIAVVCSIAAFWRGSNSFQHSTRR